MENKVLAVVAGTEIRESDLDRIINRYPQENRAMFESEMGRAQLLEQVIATELLSKLAEEKKVTETEEYKSKLNEIGKQLATEIVVNEILSGAVVSEDEAKEYYDSNKEQFNKGETVIAKHILVDSKEKCEDIKNEIASGKISFEDAAVKESTCPSKENGGSLGEFGRGMMVPEFEEAAFKLNIGELSEPVQTQFGYHLIKVEAKKPAEVLEFEKVKAQVINMLTQQAQQKAYINAVNDLQARYEVKRG